MTALVSLTMTRFQRDLKPAGFEGGLTTLSLSKLYLHMIPTV